MPELIPYKKLTWRDFPVRDDQGGKDMLARTEGRIVWKYELRWTEKKKNWFVAQVTSCEVQAYFDTRKSWRKSRLTTPDPDRLLAHEQGHLDLTRMQTLRLRLVPLEQLGSGSGESPGAAQADLDEAVKRYFEAAIQENQRAQERYDQETNHGRLLLIQLSWERRLARALTELERQQKQS
jgi:hypothetical protein